MTLLNNGFNEYKVVEHAHNIWNGNRWCKDVFTTSNLLSAYEYVLEQENFLKSLIYHDAGSPIEYTYKIDVYVDKDKL